MAGLDLASSFTIQKDGLLSWMAASEGGHDIWGFLHALTAWDCAVVHSGRRYWRLPRGGMR